MGKQEFLEQLRKGVELMRAGGTDVALVHHNDSDGLSSAAVLQTAFRRAGFTVHRICIERVHPPIITRIHDTFDCTVFYVDLGAQAAQAISEANHGRRTTLILDHHHPNPPTDPRVLSMATENYGMSGDMDISASTAAYFFALELDAANRDLAYVGVIGAVGDEHDREGGLVKENREALMDAVEQGQIRIDKNEAGKEVYSLILFGDAIPMGPLGIEVTSFGGVGYYADGPELGIRVCLEGYSPEARRRLEELRRTQSTAYEKMTARLKRDGFRQTEHIQWFSVGDDFSPMGVKIIGEYCWDIRNESFVDPTKVIVGFQNMARDVPGVGSFEWAQTKASMRLPTPLEHKVLIDKTMPGLGRVVPEAAKKVGGSIDACHDYTAATIVDIGKEDALVMEMEKLIQGELSKKAT